jgi:methylenetetrahydrofolate reductase (NADPH)
MIAELLRHEGVHISCEIFPPKEFRQVEDIKAVAREIAALSPAYISVTYGAAGNTPHFTRELSQTVQAFGVPALSHLTCINDTKSKIADVLDDLQAAGIANVLALRGDIPEGGAFPGEDHFRHASELIAAIKGRGGFSVGAACYPEGHPEAPSRDQDLHYLRQKVDAGTDFLTTQMFFDNNILYNFLYRALQKGITLPVCAGIMPVVNARQIKRITALSGAGLPPRFAAIVDRFGGDPASMREAGIAYATEQIIDLIANGVSRVHLYTMNRPDIAAAIFGNLRAILGGKAHG